jgi:ADP-ribose pyrophosphatase YjhB (NUDIX family)
VTKHLDEHVHAIESAIADPRCGLPDEIFHMVARLTPMTNVDLLIYNDRGETLLTWRDDGLYHGWHIPGGIIRFKERMADRVAEVARLELGAAVTIKEPPVAVNEVIHLERRARGHFIAFLFECQLASALDAARRYAGGPPAHGQWAWHGSYPADMIGSHEMYRRFIGRTA